MSAGGSGRGAARHSILLDHGADVAIRDKEYGRTPLGWATRDVMKLSNSSDRWVLRTE
jgi:hypothetical protein